MGWKADYDQAIQLYQTAIELDDHLIDAYCNLTGMLAMKGNLEEAETYARRLLEVAPNLQDAKDNLENVLEAKKNPV